MVHHAQRPHEDRLDVIRPHLQRRRPVAPGLSGYARQDPYAGRALEGAAVHDQVDRVPLVLANILGFDLPVTGLPKKVGEHR